MVEIDRMIFEIAKGLYKWQENFSIIPEDFHTAHRHYIKVCANHNVIPETTIPSFIQLLKKPIKEWGFSNIENEIPSDFTLIDNMSGILSDEAEELLDAYKHDIMEFEQSYVAKILKYCRQDVEKYEEIYRKIREFITEPRNAVIGKDELFMFTSQLADEQLTEYFTKCYEIVSNLSSYRKCPHCHWTVSYENGEWLCNKNVCSIFWEAYDFEEFEKSKKVMYRLTKGIQRYTLIPGISEKRIAEKLKKDGYSVTMFPKVDIYDILVESGKRNLKLDVKDYKKPFALARYINNLKMLAEWEKEIIFIVPEYQVKETPGYIDIVKKYVHNDFKDKIYSENQFYKKVGELLYERVDE